MLKFFLILNLFNNIFIYSLNHSINLRNLNIKETIQIVSYNNINGYLNWHEKFFNDYILNKCKTNCLFSTNPSDVNKFNL